MITFHAALSKLRGIFGQRNAESETEEIQLHLSLLTEKFVRQGMTPSEAAAAARRQFGNTTLLEEERRDLQTCRWLENTWRAVRYGIRQLRLNPGFTITAVLSLALGIGVNTAVFTLLDQLVLRLLPVPEPERLVMIWSTDPHLGDNRGVRASSWPLCQDYQRLAQSVESVFCRYPATADLMIGATSEPVRAELVSGNYFLALGVGPAAGRVFSQETDDKVDRGHPVVVLSHRYWTDRFGGDPNVVGRKVLVNNHPMEVAGVAASGFVGIDPAEAPQIWLPVRMKALITPEEDGLNDRHYHFVQIFGRLKHGQTLESARASLQSIFRGILEDESKDPEVSRHSKFDRDRFLQRSVLMERAASGYSDMRQRYSTALIVLMGMAGLLLLIACSNVASLQVARALARQKEMGVRLAIGAGRATLVGQLLAESLLLAMAGALLGLGLAIASTRALLSMLPPSGALLLLRPEPDLRVLLFSIAVTVVSGLAFGLLPAMQSTRLELFQTLKGTAGVAAALRSAALRKVLVVAQVSLSFLLLVGAGLFARTLANLKQTGTGLKDIQNLVSFRLNPSRNGYSVPQLRRFYSDLLREIKSTPGVRDAACTWIPLLVGWAPSWAMEVEGHRAKDGEDMEVEGNVVSPGYWRATGVRLLEGREFDENDAFDPGAGEKAPTVAVVNRKFAERFFGKQSALGRHIGIGGAKKALGIRIVGVVEDSLYAGPRAGRKPMVYFSLLQANSRIERLFYVRAATESALLFPVLRHLVAKLDPRVAIYELKTVDRQLDDTLSAERLIASLSIVFAALATVMAALGLYGVMAFIVTRRTKEIGLRMALGAPRSQVLWQVMRDALLLAASGLTVGIPFAYVLSRYVSSQLFGVRPADVMTGIVAVLILLLTAVVSGFLPARRASTIQPIRALRHE